MKLLILDRDGVINQESREYIKNPDEWLPIPGSIEAISRLCNAGYTIAVATNQSGVGRQMFTEQTLNEIHKKMIDLVEGKGGKISKIAFCPHLPTEGCRCRKPEPGMFQQITNHLGVKLEDVDPIFVGDSVCDVELGLSTGCKFFLTAGFHSDGDDTWNKLSTEQKEQITRVKNLAEIADRLLA